MEEQNKKQLNDNKFSSIKNIRVLSVLVVLFVTIVFGFFILREKYIQTLEIGENYIPVFLVNVKYMISTLIVNFLIIFFSIYITNIKIKKGFSEFFKKENREMPKLLNKTISFIGAILTSMLTSNIIMQKAMLCINNAQFEIQDPVFGLDIGYFVFIKPFIEIAIWYFIILIIALLIYTVAYYIIGLNMFFDGVDRKDVKNSRIMKQIITMIMIITILGSLLIFFKVQDIGVEKFLNLNNEEISYSLYGAGFTTVTIKMWGYIILSVLLIFAVRRAIKGFEEANRKKIILSLAIVPEYLILLFFVIIIFENVFVSYNQLDKEKQYIQNNINYTKNAYNINIDETQLQVLEEALTARDLDNYRNITNSITTNINSKIEEKKLVDKLEETKQQNKIIKEAKAIMPYFLYDDTPYKITDKDGNNIWVLDAYSISNEYPYSQKSMIRENSTSRIELNYIRNSVKVLYKENENKLEFYIMDRTDPIAMAYRNLYPNLFVDLDTKIPEDISSKFIYPEFLFKIQADVITRYHNISPDSLYRSEDIWQIASYNSGKLLTRTVTEIKPYYSKVKTVDMDEKNAIILPYTPYKRQNIVSYLIGNYDLEKGNSLRIYKYSVDDNVLGTMQLDTQLEQDETIMKQLDILNVNGIKMTKDIIVVPLDNSLLYVEPIYTSYTNEADSLPTLRKVVVASKNKVAIGDNLQEALSNLVSQYAVNIEIENTDTIDDLIDTIIKANHNLSNSNLSNNWEMMGKDVNKLQELINKLELLVEENKTKNEIETKNLVDDSINNEMISDDNV